MPAPPLALARELLAMLVAINTTASSGATTPAAESLAARFRGAGFAAADVRVIGPTARHKNLVVRWRGRDRARKAVVFNAHLDVVEAPKLEWRSDPFRLTELDGYLYGRGVIDDKGSAAAMAAAWIAAKRSGVTPDRDLVLALTAGEESGENNGVEWLLANHRSLVDGEYVLNLDTGGGELSDGKITAFSLESAEKIYLDLEMTARGEGGHSSTPPDGTPIDALARAIQRVDAYRFPVKVDPIARAYFEWLGPRSPGPLGAAMSALARERDDLSAQSTLLRDRTMRARLRTTCVTTMLRGGTAPNAIPQEASATVNCRLMPGETQEQTIEALVREVGDSSIHFRVLYPALASRASEPTPEILSLIGRAMESVAPNVSVVPYMETGASDAIFFRNAGIPVYGTNGLFVSAADAERMHGRDERISVQAFGQMVTFSDRLLAVIAGASPH